MEYKQLIDEDETEDAEETRKSRIRLKNAIDDANFQMPELAGIDIEAIRDQYASILAQIGRDQLATITNGISKRAIEEFQKYSASAGFSAAEEISKITGKAAFEQATKSAFGVLSQNKMSEFLEEQILKFTTPGNQIAGLMASLGANSDPKLELEKLFGSFNPTARFREIIGQSGETMQKMLENIGRPQSTLYEPKIRNEAPEISYFKVPKFQPINFAQNKISEIVTEKEKREAALPFGKSLKLFVIVGKREIFTLTLQAVDNFTIEVNGVDENQKAIVAKLKASDISYFFEEVDLPLQNRKIH